MTTENTALEAVIFDFGGVLLRTQDHSHRHKWDDKLDLAHGTFEDYIFNSSLGKQAQLGKTTWEQVWESAAQNFSLTTGDLTAAQRDFFKGDVLDKDLVGYIRRLKKHVKVGLLSNTWHRDGLTLLLQYGIADAFHFTVTSAEVGVMKPEPKIYQVALEKAQVTADKAVFIDDMQENVMAARQVGMQGVYFLEPDLARQRLVNLTGVK